jgi:hypothetical protein
MATTTPGRLRGRIAELAAEVPGEEDHGLAGSLARGDATAATEAARRWIGLGDGLTPRGDDLVAGTLAAFLLVGRALGDGTVPALVGGVAGPLLDHAATATTAFSAALLANAVRGEVAAPAGDLLRVLTGEGSVGPVAAGLLAVGHSSGRALAAGILAGARAAMERRLRWIT